MTCYLNSPLLAAVVVLALYAVIVFTAAGPRTLSAGLLLGFYLLLVVAGLQRFQGALWPVALALALYAYGNVHTLLIDPLYRER